jgi:hypothetical protein
MIRGSTTTSLPSVYGIPMTGHEIMIALKLIVPGPLD